MTRYIFWCVATVIFLTQGVLANDNVINWYHADFPPGFIEYGPMKGDGYENYLEKLLREHLNDYSHKYQTANYSRILEQIRTKNTCCVALIRKPERESFVEFSLPTMIALSNGLFVLTERIDEFKPFIDDTGYISIYRLFNETNFTMGVSKGRRYNGGIDEILRQNSNSCKIEIRAGNDVLQGLLRMMESRRVDYVVGYPHEIRWLKYTGLLEGDFTFIPIKEMPKYVISQIGCSKNEWGKEVIRKINKMLGGEYIQEYKKRYQKFLPPEAIKLHEQYINEVFPIKPIR